MISQIPEQGDSISKNLSSWSFSGDVPSNFDQHVEKSVPGYANGHTLITLYSDFFINLPANRIYDIGSSTGSLIQSIQNRHKAKPINYIGIEPEKDMLDIANKRQYSDSTYISFINKPIDSVKLSKSSMIISYYTIQFISPGIRQLIFDQIYESLEWGGAFFLFEKVRSPDARFQDYSTQTYQEYKFDRGYNASEIIGKSRSLKGILEPYTESANLDFLRRAGFKDIETIFKLFCFQGWLAIK